MSTEKIARILDVSAAINKSNPPQLEVIAVGQASSGNQKDPQLSRREYVTFPEDGIQDYDFFIEVPSGGGTAVVKEHEARDTWAEFPKALKGVRIHGQNNFLESLTRSSNNIIRNLVAEVFSGTAGFLIRIECEVNVGDFPEGVELVPRKGDAPEGRLHLELRNAIDIAPGNFEKKSFTANLDNNNDRQYSSVGVFQNDRKLAEAVVRRR